MEEILVSKTPMGVGITSQNIVITPEGTIIEYCDYNGIVVAEQLLLPTAIQAVVIVNGERIKVDAVTLIDELEKKLNKK